jgi:3-dehydroquinate synthase
VQYRLTVQSSGFQYVISNNLSDIFNNSSRYIVICDKKVEKTARVTFSQASDFISLEINENIKNLDGASTILMELAQLGVVRGDILIAVGGGALQDLATLAASIYMRGLEWIYVPTTLMSMLDSCIGGKSSINLGSYKNLLGNIYPPSSVYIDKSFLTTLNKVDIACGLAEGVKICFAASPLESEKFEELIASWRSTSNDEFLEQAIFLSLEKKQWFVEIDEFDKKERKLLNFGHSFGHALEAATAFLIPHGIGVFIGMHTAINYVGNPAATTSLVKWINSEMALINGDVAHFNLSKEQFLSALRKDKKNSMTEQCLIVPNADGALNEKRYPLTDENLNECFRTLVESLNKLEMHYEIL